MYAWMINHALIKLRREEQAEDVRHKRQVRKVIDVVKMVHDSQS